tara:strand:+ start:169 stop:558 length:390 start_codon:yes stop_codon:yes gene_type:complete
MVNLYQNYQKPAALGSQKIAAYMPLIKHVVTPVINAVMVLTLTPLIVVTTSVVRGLTKMGSGSAVHQRPNDLYNEVVMPLGAVVPPNQFAKTRAELGMMQMEMYRRTKSSLINIIIFIINTYYESENME